MLTMLKNQTHRVLPVCLCLALLSLPVSALTLDQARAKGMVKEAANGYLTATKPSDEVNALVKKINAGRKAHYQKIAKKQGVPLSAVEQQAGTKLSK